MEVNELRITSKADWQSLVSRDRNADFLQSYEWARMLQLSYGFEPYYLEFTEGGKSIGCALLFGSYNFSKGQSLKSHLSNRFNSAFSRSFICYNGPAVFDIEKTLAIIRGMIDWLKTAAERQHIKMVKLTLFKYNWAENNAPSLTSGLTTYGYRMKKWATYLVDLDQSEDEWST